LATRIYDVTVPISPNLPVWRGDPKVRLERSRFVDGDNVVHTLRMRLGNHTGTHVDAPRHMLDDGETLDRIPIERWLGPARVVAIDAPAIGPAELAAVDLEGVDKVLFKTRNAGKLHDPEFDPDFVALEPDGAEYLVARGVRLVGIDYLGIEAFASPDFATHHILLGAGVLIIEGLDLAAVPPGDYELLCLPLLIEAGDGAPARVILRELAV
jgi:arylformamidase